MQQGSYAFSFSAYQSHARAFSNGCQCRAQDRRDFTDGDLTASSIEEGLDVFEGDVGLVTAGLGRQRTRDFGRLLELCRQDSTVATPRRD